VICGVGAWLQQTAAVSWIGLHRGDFLTATPWGNVALSRGVSQSSLQLVSAPPNSSFSLTADQRRGRANLCNPTKSRVQNPLAQTSRWHPPLAGQPGSLSANSLQGSQIALTDNKTAFLKAKGLEFIVVQWTRLLRCSTGALGAGPRSAARACLTIPQCLDRGTPAVLMADGARRWADRRWPADHRIEYGVPRTSLRRGGYHQGSSQSGRPPGC
jgi:hypothetical protein